MKAVVESLQLNQGSASKGGVRPGRAGPNRLGLWLRSLLWLTTTATAMWGEGGMLEMRDGYFWDPRVGQYFIPRGIAYQSWNPPVGSNQSLEQVGYDLREIKKMYANSVRCEMVWNEVQTGPDQFDWTKPDYLVETASRLGLKLFVLIGFQYAPDWAPEEWGAVNALGDRSVVFAYENPAVRLAYSNYIAQVTSRYRDTAAIGGWILGNEYAYFDLWEVERRYLGYDSHSIASFRAYLKNLYAEDIAALNAVWETGYESFDAVAMPREYPADRHRPGFHDLIQWRKESVGNLVALGAMAARRNDPNHLRTYSMIGGLFGEADVHYTCEDAKEIVTACEETGAPLHFWSINNYANAAFDSELRSGDYGIGKHQAASGLPVMISETGHSSTETLHPGAGPRQAAAVPAQMWEALMSGAIGTHIFTWNDRNFFTEDYFLRERGFGIMTETRLPKEPVYANCLELFRRMEQINLDQLLGGSMNPPPDVHFFWSTNSDMGWPRANHENIRLWSTLKRLGYEPGILDDEQFEEGLWRDGSALLLSRSYQLDRRQMDLILNQVIPAGVHVHANADLPGRFNAYHQPNENWAEQMIELFGLSVNRLGPGWNAGSNSSHDMFRPVYFTGLNPLGPLGSSYNDSAVTWKIWHGVSAESGTTIVRHTGVNGAQPPMPALQVKDLRTAKTAVNTFALGDLNEGPGDTPPHAWDLRYNWMRAIYRDYFGILPIIDLTGSGAEYVFPDHRVLRNGSVLISLLNGHTNAASITVKAGSLLTGKTVEDLTSGGILETGSSDGNLQLELEGDQFVLLYAYSSADGVDESLVNPAPEKLWIDDAPTVVRPQGQDYRVTVGYDVRGGSGAVHAAFESVHPARKTYGNAEATAVSGKGRVELDIPIPDADANDTDYRATPDGGNYAFHVWLEVEGQPRSDVYLPVRLVWPVAPLELPEEVVPGATYSVPIIWQELPSYSEDGMTIDRADLWESRKATAERYQITLELRGKEGEPVTSVSKLTGIATSGTALEVTVPAEAQGPFHWSASVRAATEVSSRDLQESFEGRERGAVWPDHLGRNFLDPWLSYNYVSPNTEGIEIWQNEGVQLQGSHGSQSAFLVVTNIPNQDVSVFGIRYVFPEGDWALPEDRNRWADYRFSYDFKEEHTLDCLIEMQIKNDDPQGLGKWIEVSERYVPGPDQWDTVEASLDKFHPPPNLFGEFDPSRVHEIVVNVRMLTPSAQYVGSIDNIRFDTPDTLEMLGQTVGIYTSQNDTFGLDGLTFDPETGTVTVRWAGSAMLQTAPEVLGPWSDQPEATSPWTLKAEETQRYFRLKR